mmetsp:Transcript_49643/g.137600  ORF Transcript_49643/g.137600 Transcript_49643/m.137600 type:complete len:208 (+) Transcript_49643:730-1353(+)
MEALVPSTPSNCTCRSNSAVSGSLALSPHARRTCASGTPPQVALEMAPVPHEFPDVLRTASRPPRRLPPHCSVAVTSTFGIAFSSAIENVRADTPRPPISKAKLSSLSAGTGWWLRTNQSSLGVIHASLMREAGDSAEHGVSLSRRSAGCRVGSCTYGSSALRALALAASSGASHPTCRGARISATWSFGTGSALAPGTFFGCRCCR